MYSNAHNVYPGQNYRQVPFRASEDLMSELSMISHATGIPQSEIMRKGVERFVRHLKASGALHQLLEAYK